MATYLQRGDSIDHVPVSDVTAGDVIVIGDQVCVVKTDIIANTLGSLHLSGVFNFPKTVGVGEAINQFVDVYWDAGNSVVTTTASTHKKIGRTTAAATNDDTTTPVRMV